jgi:catechol 2,3-dioxygenase-like lactoylglutathione lyase family enzyme
METIDKLMMFAIGVNDMPKAKAFYGDKLGLKITSDYRQDDEHWWVSLSLPEGGVTITLTTYHGNTQPCAMTLWFGTNDLNSAHEALSNKGIKVSDIQDDLHGPGLGVKWFNFADPFGNLIHLEQV